MLARLLACAETTIVSLATRVSDQVDTTALAQVTFAAAAACTDATEADVGDANVIGNTAATTSPVSALATRALLRFT
jgi:hypothetical protein